MKLEAEKVLRARERLGYSLTTASERIGVARASLLNAEHGREIRPLTARKIAEGYGLKVADLIAENGSRPKAQAPLPFADDAEQRFEEDALDAKRRAMELLRAWRAFIDRTVRRWEASQPTAAQVRDVLDALEPMVEGRVFEPAFGASVGVFTEEERFELEMLHNGVGRLRVAAKDAIADQDAERARRAFRSIDWMGAA